MCWNLVVQIMPHHQNYPCPKSRLILQSYIIKKKQKYSSPKIQGLEFRYLFLSLLCGSLPSVFKLWPWGSNKGPLKGSHVLERVTFFSETTMPKVYLFMCIMLCGRRPSFSKSWPKGHSWTGLSGYLFDLDWKTFSQKLNA